jgi:hypothetical protein
MQSLRSKEISESARSGMISESMVLAFRPGTNLASVSVVAAIADAMAAIGDQLQRIRIETGDGKKHTHSVADIGGSLSASGEVKYLSAFPRSEIGNSQARWLTTAIAFNNSQNARTLFLGIPVAPNRERFAPHLVFLRSLLSHGLMPQYGFGFYREYGFGPDYFAIGHVFNTTARDMDPADWNRIGAWAAERAGDPATHPRRHRYLKGLVLDVFPMNVLTNVHLETDVRGIPLKTWIAQTTGPGSLLQIGEDCFAWNVPLTRTVEISERLDEAGLVIAKPPRRTH